VRVEVVIEGSHRSPAGARDRLHGGGPDTPLQNDVASVIQDSVGLMNAGAGHRRYNRANPL
jgi:hypothetical protein